MVVVSGYQKASQADVDLRGAKVSARVQRMVDVVSDECCKAPIVDRVLAAISLNFEFYI